jgi:hypothetical protein
MGNLGVVSNSLQMQHMLPRSWIAIAISTLAIVHSHPAIAKPTLKITASQTAERVPAANGRSNRSIREVFASSDAKSAIQPKRNIRSGVYPGRFGTSGNRSMRGIADLTNPRIDRVDRSSPVNRLIK